MSNNIRNEITTRIVGKVNAECATEFGLTSTWYQADPAYSQTVKTAKERATEIMSQPGQITDEQLEYNLTKRVSYETNHYDQLKASLFNYHENVQLKKDALLNAVQFNQFCMNATPSSIVSGFDSPMSLDDPSTPPPSSPSSVVSGFDSPMSSDDESTVPASSPSPVVSDSDSSMALDDESTLPAPSISQASPKPKRQSLAQKIHQITNEKGHLFVPGDTVLIRNPKDPQSFHYFATVKKVGNGNLDVTYHGFPNYGIETLPLQESYPFFIPDKSKEEVEALLNLPKYKEYKFWVNEKKGSPYTSAYKLPPSTLQSY